MTNNQEKQLRGKLTKWLQAKGETPEDVDRKTNAWLQYFDGIKKPVVALAACTWLCSGAVILPEDMPKVEQAVRIAEINRVDPLRFNRPMSVFEAFPSTELKEAPIDPDTVPTLHLVRRFDSGLAIYDVDETQESRENMRKIINTHFGKDSSPWCLLQGDGEGNLTEGSLEYWNHYNAYPKQVAFVDGKLAAFSANGNRKKVWWDRMDESHEDIVVLGRIKGDSLGRSASCCFNQKTGDVRYKDIVRRRDDVIVERYADIEDGDYTLDILVDPKKKEKITSVVIPDGVTEIEELAFMCCSSLREIHIPDGVMKIGWDAFKDCTSLQKAHIPGGVAEIGRYAFADCVSLQEVQILDGVTEIGHRAFEGCTSLKEIHIPDSVKYIGESVFRKCISLQEIHIPDGVTKIGGNTFEDCISLQEIHIPDSVKEIGKEAFWGCASLREVHIPDSVTKIGNWAFKGCTSLQEIHIPDGVTKIGDWAFYGCSSLQEIHIPDGVTKIGDGTFKDCSSLQKIHIPDGVTEIGWDAFAGCTSLKEIRISDGVTKIGAETFYNCSSLQEIHIPDSVTEIEELAFYNCSSLQEIHIPDSVTEIEELAFEACSSLREIHIPDRVKVIGHFAIADCPSLREVHVSASAPQALINRLHEVVSGGCAVLRDLSEKDLAALRERGVSEAAIREMQENGSVHIKEKTFYRPSTETSPCPESARTVHTDVIAALEDGSVKMKDPKTGMDLGDTKSFFNRRNRPDIKTVQQVVGNSKAIRKGR